MLKDPTQFRERFKMWKDGKNVYEAGRVVKKYENNEPEGSAQWTRNNFWNTNTTLWNATDSIANKYGIDPDALRNRLNREGFVDKASNMKNLKGNSLLQYGGFSGANDFGLDDAGSMILNGKVNPINEAWYDEDFVNERGRKTHGAVGETTLDNIGITAAVMKYFTDLVKKDYPAISDYDANRYAQAYYNKGVSGGRKWVTSGAKGYNYQKEAPVNGGMLPEVVIYPKNHPITRGIVPRPYEFPMKFKEGKDSLPKFYEGDDAVRVGNYNVYPSAIGASELNVTTPEVVITGKDRRPLYQRYDAERSAYNPNDVINGFNVLTLGGMNNLSPTQWARRFYDTPKLFSGDLSFSDYTNRWLNGNEGVVSANFEKNHPYISMAINGGADILTGAAVNKLLQLNKLSKLQKMYTGVPKKVDKATGEFIPDLFRRGYNGTVWTSNNPDYGYYLTNGGETFDVFFDPKKLNLMDTPHAPEGTYFVWNRLPFKGKGGKIRINPKAEVDNTTFTYNTKDDVLANTDKFGNLLESHDALHPLMEPRLMSKNTLGFKAGLKTDHIVRYSKMLNHDGTKFHNVYDGGAEDLHGFIYDTPIEEVVLNPGAEYFWTEHGAGLKELFNKMPYKNVLGYSTAGAASNIIRTAQMPNANATEGSRYKNGKDAIRIKPSKRGTFTAAAKKHGKSVQLFASQVLANKSKYSPAMVKKANFAKNASKWNH